MNPSQPISRTQLRRGSVVLALALLLPLVVGSPSRARPSQEDLDAAKNRLAEANEHLEVLVEKYDSTQVAVDELSAQLEELRALRDRSTAKAEEATSRLEAVAVEAYKNPNSSIEMLLTSHSITDMSDRLQMLDTLAQIQEDTATIAEVQREQARRASVHVSTALSEQRELLSSLGDQRDEIEGKAATLEKEIDELEEALREPVLLEVTPATAPTPLSSGPIGIPPPVSGQGAAAAIAAAESVLGTPYVYAGSSPEQGFDCSGLTMWAWAHGGVSLPHSSASQYEVLPHVDKTQLQPGDLVFFYNPIHHVGLYVGGGMMIDAPHTGTVVQRRAVEWSVYTGAARPG